MHEKNGQGHLLKIIYRTPHFVEVNNEIRGAFGKFLAWSIISVTN